MRLGRAAEAGGEGQGDWVCFKCDGSCWRMLAKVVWWCWHSSGHQAEGGLRGLRAGLGRLVRRHVVTRVKMFVLTSRAVGGEGADHHGWAAGKTSWRKCE